MTRAGQLAARENRAREKAYAAYRKAVTRWAVFAYDPLNRYPRGQAVSELYRREYDAERACDKLVGQACQYVVRTVTLTDEEAGVTRP